MDETNSFIVNIIRFMHIRTFFLRNILKYIQYHHIGETSALGLAMIW